MQFASRVGSGSSILSPLAQPYRVGDSVAAFLQDQARSPPAAKASYSHQDMRRLESMLQELENTSVDDESDENATVQHSSNSFDSLLPNLELSATLATHMGPIIPPSPAPSVKLALPEEPVVRVTMQVWDAMGRDLGTLKEEKRALEAKIAQLGKQKAAAPVDNSNSDLELQIGKLHYQNESNKTQKATMARALSEKDIQIKHLQLELDSVHERLETISSLNKEHANVAAERDYLQAALKNVDSKDCEIQTLSQKIEDLQEKLRQAADNGEYKLLAEQRLDQLCKREKQLQAIREKYTAEQIKVGNLEDHVEAFQDKLHQVSDLQAQLSEKTSTCDRLRTKSKQQEKKLEDAMNRLARASSDHSLRGATHLVKPDKNTKFSSLVMGCSECYAKNISCDNKARCRNCTESNETCARWRCSLRHILGQCPTVPCTFPHEEDG